MQCSTLGISDLPIRFWIEPRRAMDGESWRETHRPAATLPGTDILGRLERHGTDSFPQD